MRNEAALPHFSAIIVGAGPTGLALGNLLGIYGLDALIIERNSTLSTFPKAISLDDEGLRICQAMGLAEAVQANLLFNLEAHYISGRRLLARVAPLAQRNGYPLISTFHQPTFEATLLAGLKRFPKISMQFDTRLETFTQNGEGVIVEVRTADGESHQISCAYLLACDGAKSTARTQLKIAMPGQTYPQRWLVVDSINDPNPAMEIHFFCNPARPAVTVPAPGQRRRWEFMLLPGESETEITQPERIHALIQQVNGPAQPQIIRAAVYTFHATLAQRFQQERVFLLGDAAHLMPPFGGQGMNCGLRDAHNLVWKLWLVLQGVASPTLLTSYTLERQAHTRQMLDFSRFLGAIIMTTARPIASGRNAFFALTNLLPAARNYLSQAGIKPAPRYKHGFFAHNGGRTSRALAGLMLPQPQIRASNGQLTPLDDLLGPGFALLHPEHASAQALACLAQQPIWQLLQTRMLPISSELRAALPVNEEQYILVRPDRYIYGVCRNEEIARLAEEIL